MLRIDEIYFLQYMMLFPAQWRCPLSDHYMRSADSGSGKAFVLKENEKPVAYAVLIKENQGWILKYIFTDKAERRKGYASYLIREIIMRTEKYLRVHILRSQTYYNAISACLNNLGFIVNDTSCVYSVEVGESLWKHMDELQLVRMKEFLLRDSSECIPFCKMDDNIKDQLLSSASNSFSNTLNPAEFMQNNSETIDLSISTVLVKNGELKAYTLITRPSKNTVSVEQISESHNEIGNGRIVAPLCTSLEAIRKAPEITMMKMAVSDRNTRSYSFVTEILKGQKISSTKNISFIITAEMLK